MIEVSISALHLQVENTTAVNSYRFMKKFMQPNIPDVQLRSEDIVGKSIQTN